MLRGLSIFHLVGRVNFDFRRHYVFEIYWFILNRSTRVFYFLFNCDFLLPIRKINALSDINSLSFSTSHVSLWHNFYFSSKFFLNSPWRRHLNFLLLTLDLYLFALRLVFVNGNNNPEDIFLGIWSHLGILIFNIFLIGKSIIKLKFQLCSLRRLISQFNSNLSLRMRLQEIMSSLKRDSCFLIGLNLSYKGITLKTYVWSDRLCNLKGLLKL